MEERATLTEVSFADLPGWPEKATPAQALTTLQHACKQADAQPPAAFDYHIDADDWRRWCEQALATSPHRAQAFFEATLTPYRVRTNRREQGQFTGYFTPILQGRYAPDARFHVPVYRRPPDALCTRFSRRDINRGALSGQGLELLWLDDPVAAFFLHIQGSGYVELPGGELRKLVFAGKNEFPYTAIGRDFIASGEVDRDTMSMQWLTDWLKAHPQEAPAVMERNASYIFFALEEIDDGVKGAQGSPLTPWHSIAIDPDWLGYGLPAYLHAPQADITTLAVTQDTGSAIKGPIRADLYFGVGEEAARQAGGLDAPLQLYLLLPRREIEE